MNGDRLDEESCAMTNESTPLHVNTAYRNRSASYGSHHDAQQATPLTFSNIVATSPPDTRSSCISSNLSTAS
eukprot:CAMPEP_0172567692 /NCGR_PEP_ID=MMETSP1067-20121228/116812_1 /TAXON_ID=265564 ORGANISM="Thalassiosira punctigera, Strain Tpunct2005C2" /NCGR_SAMPLE_ID=MMETSP1067 /ASSEMBLY_ACC=CAM_ASM_000444 /LENGTH=71 /DNA_ID=CAMNT_0013359099 /DNA_START=25 /DNA_END=236 /DNA_ORIENTATION=-